MYNKCCVVSCDSRRKDVNLYRFPKSETGLNKWLECINCARLRSLSFQQLRKSFVCQKHFEKKFLASGHARSRLRINAYPTLFTESEITTGVPLLQSARLSENTKNAVYTDHDYLKKRRHEDHCYCKTEIAEKRPRKEIGKILKGTDVIRLKNKKLPPMQAKALQKFEMRIRNKRLQK